MLEYLVTTYDDEEHWSQFLDADGALDWSETVIAGSSLGAGQAAIIAEQHSVYRVVLLHGWTDANHGWVKTVATTAKRLTGISRSSTRATTFFSAHVLRLRETGLAAGCPLAELPHPDRDGRPGTRRWSRTARPAVRYGTTRVQSRTGAN